MNARSASARGAAGGIGSAGAMATIPATRSRMVRGEQHRSLDPSLKRDQHRSIGAGRLEHSQGVGRELLLGVGLRLPGAIGAAVTATVEGDDAVVTREVRDLPLPAA